MPSLSGSLNRAVYQRFDRIFLALPLPEGTMAVGFESEEIHLYRLRERLRAMSDEALIMFGKQIGTGVVCSARP